MKKKNRLQQQFEKEIYTYIEKYMTAFKHETSDVVYVGCTESKWCDISYREHLTNMHQMI